MKITGYQQSLTNAGGGSSARLNLSASAKAAASEAVDLSPVIKGIGEVAKTVDYVHEQEDKANILAAMDSYNQNVNDLMHNETDGLMNTKEEGAAGITDKYLEGTKKIKDTVLGNTRLHFRGNQQALDNFFNKASEQGFEQVRAHQYKQDQIVQDNHLGNIKSAALVKAGDNYNNRAALALGKTALGFAVEFRYSSFGEERVEAEKRKAYGEYGAAAMQNAVANNDIEAQRKIFEDYGEYMSQQQRANYQKLSAKQQESNWQYSILDAIKGMNSKDALAYIDGINFREEQSIGFGGDLRQQAAQAAKYVEQKTGIPANLIYAQWKHESGNFSSQLTKENMNLGGLTQTTPNGEDNKQPDGNNYYKKYGSIQEYADDYIKSFIGLYKFNPADIKSPEAFAKLLKDNGYYGDSVENYTAGIKGGVGDFESALNSAGSGNVTRRIPLSREEKEHLRNLAIKQINQEHNNEQRSAKELQDSIRQEIYNNKMSFEDAQKQFVTGKQWSSPKERDAAAAAVALEFGTSKGVAKGTKPLRQNKGKGDKMVDYEMQKLVENNAFVNEEGLPDRTVLMNYLAGPDCADMTQTQKYKAVTLFDHFTEKTGPYKIKWNEFDDQMLAGTGFKGDAKEYALANCRAAALDYIMNYKPQENLGRQFPTMEEIVQAGRKGMLTNWQVTYYDEEEGFFGGVNKVKKTASIPEGALRAAGYTYWKDEGEDSTLATLKDKSGTTRNVSKKALVEKFKQ